MTRPFLHAAALALFCAPLAQAQSAGDILKVSGVKGGLVVHVGCGNPSAGSGQFGKLTTALHVNERYLVHGLDTDTGKVAGARSHISSLDLHGPVSVDVFDGKHLPYADSLVNLLVLPNAESRLPNGEIERVLAPRGVALVNPQSAIRIPHSDVVGQWRVYRKPVPDDIDDWTHYLHGPDGNAVAHDRVVGAPKHIQWIGGPLWSRSHEYDSSLCAMISERGRLFYIFDEGPTGLIDKRIPDRWMLTARDAFNGVVLWKREIPLWGWKAWRTGMATMDWRTMRSNRCSSPLAVPRRLVAIGDRVYVTLGYDAPVSQLDAATGETLRTYEGTERTDEIVCRDGTLVLVVRPKKPGPAGKKGKRPPAPTTVVALDTETGNQRWAVKAQSVVPLSLAMSGKGVVFHDRKNVVCIDAASGKRRWATPTQGAAATLVLHKDAVLCANGKQFVALSMEDGAPLWKLPGAKGFGIANPPDLFVADGLVWYGRGGNEPESITGYNPLTGKPGRTVDMGPFITHGHHARCYRSKATDNYLFLPKRATELIDIKGDRHSRHNWFRGACRYGVLPCNGLLYGTPHPCFCYAGVKMGGFLATAPACGQESGVRGQEAVRLEKGPAHDKVTPDSWSLTPESWPIYRHDAKRSGSTAAIVDAEVSESWGTILGGKLTQPVVADGRLFVARVDAGQIVCLDADTGKTAWDFVAGGRIDSAPTWHKGYLLFGSADGWVYALRAKQ
jgi:outer membrane protein assembly factor BamB